MRPLVIFPYRPKSAFLGGVALLCDFANTPIEYKQFDTGLEADMYALQKDWEAVRQDLQITRQAIRQELGH